ncbi:MAG: Na+/H+ antiporter NhaA [Gemmatimonas sp.]
MSHHTLASGTRASLIVRVLNPFQRFFATSAASGVVLLVCTIAALLWANSAWAESYYHLWEQPFSVGGPGWTLTLSLHAWVNDGLMAVFFFLVGLEIKREVLVGELATRRTATLPVAAALGGMVVPALLYAAVNAGGPGATGWGVPMATDIAFALGVLALLGDRVPSSLRVFLAALAIADDLGAVLVIAVFYSSGLNWTAIELAAGVLAILWLMNRTGVRKPVAYMAVGVVLWGCMLASGVHATLAGVLLAMVVPAKTLIGEDDFIAEATASLDAFRSVDAPGSMVICSREHQEALQRMETATDAAQAPLQRIEHALHGYVAFVIMPLFALANAGVALVAGMDIFRRPVAIGIVLGLAVGKPVGITLASWIAIRLGVADLPPDVSWKHLHGAAWLGGIGFTMSLFIAALAFGDSDRLETAKIAVLGASICAGFVGFLILKLTKSSPDGLNHS